MNSGGLTGIQWDCKEGKSRSLSQSLDQHCRTGEGGIGTERQAVTRGLPASSRQILSPWATGSGAGTTLKSESATVFPVCHIGPGTVNRSSAIPVERGREGKIRGTSLRPASGEIFLGRLCHGIMS